MLNLHTHFKDYRNAGAFHSLIAIESVVDEHIFATKSGDLAVFIRLQGIDPECWEPEACNQAIRRKEIAARVFDHRFRVYEYHFKQPCSALPVHHSPHALVNEALRNRAHTMNNKPTGLFRTDIVMVIVHESLCDRDHRKAGGILASLRAAFSATRKSATLTEELRQSCELLLSKVNTFVVQLREFVGVDLMDQQAAFTMQRRLLNASSVHSNGVRLGGPSFVDYQLCGSHLEHHQDFLRLNDDFIAVLTLKEPPPQTHALMLANLSDLPCSFVAVSEWQRSEQGKMRRLIGSKRRHFHNTKSALSGQLSANTHGPADVLVNDAAVAMVGSLGACLEEMEVKGRSFGAFTLSIVLTAKDPDELRRHIAQCHEIFAAHDAQLIEERYNRLNAWLATFPGNSAFNLRSMWLTDTNAADLSLVFAPATGDVHNQHLNADYLAAFEGRGHAPYFFNLHVLDVGHLFVCGATGSGKSFTLNFLLTHLQKYNPLVRIFDLGESYKSLTEMINGSYLSVRPSERPFTINPFCLSPTKENLLFLLAWLKTLIGSPVGPDEEQDLFEQIENLYHVAADQRRLSTLAHIVHPKLRRALQCWTQSGPYGSLFDNAQDTLTMAPFQAFDFEGMMDTKEALEPLLFYILHRANAAILDDPARLKIMVIDEAWRFFAHPVLRAYMVEALKTWRRRNACLILATQSADDLITSAMLPVVMESCPTQLFLANPRMDRERYRQAFHLNGRELDLISTLTPKKEMLVKRPDHSKVLRLDVGAKEYWIYTNNASDSARKRDAFTRYGFEAGLEHLIRENQ